MINHHRRGRGEPLVLVHGIGSHWQIWWPVLALVARERDVVALDLPGFGRSRRLPDGEEPTVERLARAVREFCEAELGWESAHVAGNSLGGGIALELGRTGFARSVTGISPIGFHNRPELAYARAVLRAGRVLSGVPVPRPARLALASGFMARPTAIPRDRLEHAMRDLNDAAGWDATLRHAIGWRWPGGELDVPVTIAWGTRDALLLPTQARRAERALPQARHVRLKGSGHVPTWEAAEELAALLTR